MTTPTTAHPAQRALARCMQGGPARKGAHEESQRDAYSIIKVQFPLTVHHFYTTLKSKELGKEFWFWENALWKADMFQVSEILESLCWAGYFSGHLYFSVLQIFLANVKGIDRPLMQSPWTYEWGCPVTQAIHRSHFLVCAHARAHTYTHTFSHNGRNSLDRKPHWL